MRSRSIGSLRSASGLLAAAACASVLAGCSGSDGPAVVPPGVTVFVSPATATVVQGGTQQFSGQVTGTSDTSLIWSVLGTPSGSGAITASGLYTAPNVPGAYTVMATSHADPTASATATVTVPQVALTLSPTALSLPPGGIAIFTASVSGTRETGVRWTVLAGGAGGTISAAGVYIAPQTGGVDTVVVTSVGDPLQSASAQVSVLVPVSVTVSPASAIINQGASQQFTAKVAGTDNAVVTWSVDGPVASTISPAGKFTAPFAPGTYTVRAQSGADPTKSGSATVLVPPIAVSVSPTTVSVAAGGSTGFTATVTGTDNTAVVWSVNPGGLGGSINAAGVYTAPSVGGTDTVAASSIADRSKIGQAVVTVTPPVTGPITVSVSPSTVTLSYGQTQTFNATVTGTVNTAVTWSALSGTIDPTGIYHAPASGSSDTVTATSAADNTKNGTAAVTLVQSVPSVVPQVAKSLQLGNFKGVSVATDGSSYVTGLLTGSATFDGITLVSAGAGDVFLAKYDGGGNTLWARNYGDAADQEPTGVAVTSSVVAAIGLFNGAVGPVTNGGSAPIDYLLAMDPTTGNILWGKSFNLGLGGNLTSVGANPKMGLIAVCGQAVQAATDLVAGATYGGLTDVVIGVFDSTGALKWSKQIGTANNELCTAITVDNQGNVVAAGRYDGSGTVLGFTGTQLPAPGSSFRKHIWVATFNGTTGAATGQVSFGSGAGSHLAEALSVDGSGNIILSGAFTNSIPFGAFTAGTACTATQPGCFVASGPSDAFVAKLTGALVPTFATRIGSTGASHATSVAVDSLGNIVAVGLTNGSSTSSVVTPTTLASAPVSAFVTPSTNAAAFLAKLPGTTGIFNAATSSVYGNATNTVGASSVSINNAGSGTSKDLVVFGGTYGGTLNFGGSSSPISTASPPTDFLVFGKLQ